MFSTLVDENVNVVFIWYGNVDDGFNKFVIFNTTTDGYTEFLYNVTGVKQSTLLVTNLKHFNKFPVSFYTTSYSPKNGYSLLYDQSENKNVMLVKLL